MITFWMHKKKLIDRKMIESRGEENPGVEHKKMFELDDNNGIKQN